MSKPAEKKSFGFITLLAAVLLSLAAGIYFLVIHGTFGLRSTHNGVCFDPLIPWLLIGGALIACGLAVLKRYGLASAFAVAVPGAALCLFIHKCYWYVTDVFVGIDEPKGVFDPKFLTFVILVVLAFVIGEIALYLRKTKKPA